MRIFILTAVLVLGAWAPSVAQTVTLHLSWSVTNVPTVPTEEYRLEENVAGVWSEIATLPVTQTSFSVTGRAPGTYTFRVFPVAGGFPE